MPNLRNGSKGGFEPGLTRLRVRHSTAELPRSSCSKIHLSTFGFSMALFFLQQSWLTGVSKLLGNIRYYVSRTILIHTVLVTVTVIRLI